jgi:hypothetical protein
MKEQIRGQIQLKKKQLRQLQPLFDKINDYARDADRLHREARGAKGMILAQIFEGGSSIFFVIPPGLAVKIYDLWLEYFFNHENLSD